MRSENEPVRTSVNTSMHPPTQAVETVTVGVWARGRVAKTTTHDPRRWSTVQQLVIPAVAAGNQEAVNKNLGTVTPLVTNTTLSRKSRVGRRQRTGERGKRSHPLIGTAYVHTVIDGHSRVAYAEIHTDEKAATAVGVLQRAAAWFADHGVTVERVLSDDGSCYRSHTWRDACAELDITPTRTRPYRPQTKGKIERFHRTLDEVQRLRRFLHGKVITFNRQVRPPCSR